MRLRAAGASDSVLRATSDKSARQVGGQTRDRVLQSGEHVVDVDIDALAPNGDGIAISKGRRLTVPSTIPGERVRIRIIERGRAPALVSLVEILRTSPHRVTPRCRHFGLDAKPGVGIHHINFGLRLKEKMDKLGIECVVRHADEGAKVNEEMVDFFVKKLR